MPQTDVSYESSAYYRAGQNSIHEGNYEEAQTFAMMSIAATMTNLDNRLVTICYRLGEILSELGK